MVIPGGSGQVGTVLARAWHARGDEVVVLSRNPASTPWRTVTWDGESRGDWVAELEGADVVANMVGRSVNCRYTPSHRAEIMQSRVQSTRLLGEVMASLDAPPKVWLQASTATIYKHRYDAPNDEATGILGGSDPDAPERWRFSIEVAKAWEAAADATPLPHTRVVKLRSAMTMSPDRDGVFDTLLGLVRTGLGGQSGDGRQFVSWIHDEDFVRALNWIVEHDTLSGAVNVASPNPLPNADFMRGLREAWGTGMGLRATPWMLEIGAFALRTESELILKSRRVVPGRLLEDGFEFEYPDWSAAAAELTARWRHARTFVG